MPYHSGEDGQAEFSDPTLVHIARDKKSPWRLLKENSFLGLASDKQYVLRKNGISGTMLSKIFHYNNNGNNNKKKEKKN